MKKKKSPPRVFFRFLFAVLYIAVTCCFSGISVSWAGELATQKGLLGDADQNGAIEAADARLALRLTVGLEKLTSDMFVLCDVDMDAEITPADARLILRYSVSLESYTPIEVDVPIMRDTSIFNTAPPEAPKINAGHRTFTFVVYGNGHGVGLSQYGAMVMARAGYTYDEILSHYYEGTVTVKDNAPPKTTYYGGSTMNTYELLVRITQQEIGGITEGLPEASKAQAVAVYTLLKQNDFSVQSTGSVGEINWSKTFDSCREDVKQAVKEVFGEYVVKAGDKSRTPVLTVYSAMAAGRSVACEDIWWADYPTSVSSPFEMSLDNFYRVYTYSADYVKQKIVSYSGSVKLSEDPAEWIKILEHTKSIDENRGYVTKIQVGDKVLNKVGAFDSVISFPSGCFTVTYTP